MVLLIDNYDSFVHNLARYFQRLGQETVVVRNDAITPDQAVSLRPDAIVLSPGPCTPAEAGCTVPLVQAVAGKAPILGVCLGHQAIGAAFGAQIVRASRPLHGQASRVHHNGQAIMAGVSNPLTVGRYHSLVVDEATLPQELEAIAHSDDGVIMALAHRELPIFGVQFHPESVLTEGGYQILANFLRLARIRTPQSIPAIESERPAIVAEPAVPQQPVTF